MHRRFFVGGLLAACAAPRPRPRATRIRAIAFDLFTIFDPRAIDRACTAELGEPGGELARLWKLRTFEYCWLRAAAGHYAPFDQLLADALGHACTTLALAPSAAARARLVAAWTELAPWPDSAAALARMRDAGLALAPLANFAPAMIERLLARAELRALFAQVISTDAARSYKPAARAYQLGTEVLQLPREAIAFAAFGGWDAAGATWFGYPTFWVNRFGVTPEALVAPAATGADLVALAAWVDQLPSGSPVSSSPVQYR